MSNGRQKEFAAFAFGSSPAMADDRLARVIAGLKTATSSPVSSHGSDDSAWPSVGQRFIVLNGRGLPAAVIETTGIAARRFDEVDQDHAIAEGYASLAEWASVHEADYVRNGAHAPDMLVLCETFHLIEVMTGSAPRHAQGALTPAERTRHIVDEVAARIKHPEPLPKSCYDDLCE